jgi:alpha-beta hydrolase superfamily lysophospholipase
MTALRCLLSLLLAATLAACATPYVQPAGNSPRAPAIETAANPGLAAVMSDGVRLPLRLWPAEAGAPKAVIVALHGFNDYSNAFKYPAPYWARHGIATYAYDQRGFGAASEPGRWAGVEQLVADLVAVVRLVGMRHPNTPIVLAGDSMGGAVTLVALADQAIDWRAMGVERAVLIAPAVWGGDTLNPFYRLVLWLAVHTAPGEIVTGRGLNITPSDNIEMLRELGRDPLVIKSTRIDAVYGLVGLMDRALAAAPEIKLPLLVLYGEKDEIIPRRPTAAMAARLSDAARLAVYPDGYHMVLRDLAAETVWADVGAWIADPQAPLPSGAERPKDKLFR